MAHFYLFTFGKLTVSHKQIRFLTPHQGNGTRERILDRLFTPFSNLCYHGDVKVSKGCQLLSCGQDFHVGVALLGICSPSSLLFRNLPTCTEPLLQLVFVQPAYSFSRNYSTLGVGLPKRYIWQRDIQNCHCQTYAAFTAGRKHKQWERAHSVTPTEQF